MLWLAMIHGANGMRTIINDYAERDGTPARPQDAAVPSAPSLVLVLGTLVIFTFDPCHRPRARRCSHVCTAQ